MLIAVHMFPSEARQRIKAMRFDDQHPISINDQHKTLLQYLKLTILLLGQTRLS